jgi:enoyl-CoA hydratase
VNSPVPLRREGTTVWTITLDRPDQRNAVNPALHEALLAELDAAARDHEVRAIVVTGAGSTFSAGGDLQLIQAMQTDHDLRHATLATSRSIFNAVTSLSVPIVAAVNGPAVGAGCTIALLADVVFIAAGAYLADPHVNLGLVPGDGATVLWPLLAGLPAARAYLLTGDRISAAEAHRVGLVHRVVPDAEVVSEAVAFAGRLASRPAAAVRATKQALNLHLTGSEPAFEFALDAEARSFDSEEHRAAVRKLLT